MARDSLATTAFAKATVVKKNTKATKAMKPSGVAWLGDIPEGWEVDKAKRFFRQTNTRGNATPTLLAATQKYGMYPQDRLEGVVKVKEETDLQLFKTVHIDDFVISLRSFQGGFAHSSYEGVCSPAYQTFHATKVIWPRFYSYLFKSGNFIQMINSLTVGIREGKNINYCDFAECLMINPPLPEQRAIADYLDEKCGAIDAAIAEAKKGIEEYKAWKKSLIFEAVTGKRRVGVFNAETQRRREVEKMKPSGIPWIGEIPEGWRVCRVKEVATIKTGNTPDKQYQNEYYSTDSGVPWIKAENLGFMVPISQTAEYLTEEGVKQGRIFPPRTVFVCCIASIGKVGYSEKVASCNQQLNALVFNSRMYWKYGFYVTIAAEEEYLVRASGNVVKILNSSEQGLIAVPLPSIPEQQAIADYIDEKCAAIDAMAAEKEALIADLEAYKKSLIYETVTGKREVA